MPRRSRSIKRGAGAIVMLFACITTGACSLFVATDGLGPSAASDASIEADASNDVVSIDAHDEIAIDAAPAPFCIANASALFCDDFDVGTLGAKWDNEQHGDGTIALDATQFRSTPLSALFTADGNSSVVQLSRTLALSAGSYRVAFAMRIATPPSGGSSYAILARVDNGNGAQLEIFEDQNSFSVNDRINGAFGTYYSGISGITIGAWVDLVIHVKLASSGGTSSASIDVDGVNVVPTFDIASAFAAPSAVGLAIGYPYCTGSSCVASYDNVAISTE